jgi:hypothetical protein
MAEDKKKKSFRHKLIQFKGAKQPKGKLSI